MARHEQHGRRRSPKYRVQRAERAKKGDRLVIKSHRVGETERDAEIIEVQGDHGEPPYVVRWTEDGHETLVYPGSDAEIQHPDHKTSRS